MLLGLGYFFKEQKSKKDYFLGGREMGTFPLTLSTMATQLSAISFHLRAGVRRPARRTAAWSGCPTSSRCRSRCCCLMVYVLPALYRSGVVSIYDYLERRFGLSTRC